MCDGRPVSYGHGPFLTYVAVSEINQFFKGGVIREHALVFCHFPYLAVIALDGIGGINHASYIRCKLEVFGKLFPVVLPRLDDDRIFLAPFFIQIKKLCFSGFLAYSTIDMFQVFHELFLMSATDILDGVAYLMDNAELYNGVGEDTLDGIREAFQTINTSYEDVTNTTVL